MGLWLGMGRLYYPYHPIDHLHHFSKRRDLHRNFCHLSCKHVLVRLTLCANALLPRVARYEAGIWSKRSAEIRLRVGVS